MRSLPVLTLVFGLALSACAEGVPDEARDGSITRDAGEVHRDARAPGDAAPDDAAPVEGASSDNPTPRDSSVPASTHAITAFAFLARDNADLARDLSATISGSAITLEVPNGTGLTALVPTVAIDGASVAPASGAARDFSAPVTYTVSAEDGSTADYAVTVTVAAPPAPAQDCTPTAPVCDRSLYDRARAFAAANPTRNGGSWAGWCAALVFRFGQLPSWAARASAIIAYHDSHILGTDPAAAPVGAVHWWDIGEYGHVAVDLLGGGTTLFMASSHLQESWGTALGVTSLAAYNAASGARYLGWSMDYAGAPIAGGGAAACTAGSVPAGCPIPASATATSGSPDGWFWMKMQLFARANGYTGPIDGVMGVHSWAGVQRGLRSAGYTGPDDGVPGTNTYAAMQRIAAMYGYTGPVDGELGPNSYRGFARFLNTSY